MIYPGYEPRGRLSRASTETRKRKQQYSKMKESNVAMQRLAFPLCV